MTAAKLVTYKFLNHCCHSFQATIFRKPIDEGIDRYFGIRGDEFCLHFGILLKHCCIKSVTQI